MISSSTRDKLTRMRDFTKFHSKTSLKGKTDEYSLFLVAWKEPAEKPESALWRFTVYRSITPRPTEKHISWVRSH